MTVVGGMVAGLLVLLVILAMVVLLAALPAVSLFLPRLLGLAN